MTNKLVDVIVKSWVTETQSFTVTPQKITDSNYALVTGTTDEQGKAHIKLPPSIHPYLVQFKPSKEAFGETGVKLKDNYYFLVIGTSEELDTSLTRLDNITYDPYSPSGGEIYKNISNLVKTNEKYLQAAKTSKTLQEELTELQGAKEIHSDLIKTQSNTFEAALTKLTKLVDTFSTTQEDLINTLNKLIAEYKSALVSNQEAVLFAKDYMIANNMGMLNLNGHWIWFDDTDTLRWKKGEPDDQYDGKAVN